MLQNGICGVIGHAGLLEYFLKLILQLIMTVCITNLAIANRLHSASHRI